MLPIDLLSLESAERFQGLCFRLARKEFPCALPVAFAGWDGGRDILQFDNEDGDIVWQCKFTRRGLNSGVRKSISNSLATLDSSNEIALWVLCIPVDPSGKFLNWTKTEISKYPFIKSWQIWGRQELLLRLENNPDVLEAFFYPIWKALETRFRTEELELISLKLANNCSWKAVFENTLLFCQAGGKISDLLLDIVVRNRGTLESLIVGGSIELIDVRRHLRGLPGEGLLYPQITYCVSLKAGKPGMSTFDFEPPLQVKPKRHERFKMRFTDTGFAWSGALRLSLRYGNGNKLVLPWIWLFV